MLLWALMLGAAQTVGALIVDRMRQRGEGTDPASAVCAILDEHLDRIATMLEGIQVISDQPEQPPEKPAKGKRNG